MANASRIPITDFPIFMKLVPELRSKIWLATLPDTIKPALFRYKKGCWHLLHLTKYDPCGQYNRRDDTKNMRLEFRHNMLGHVQIETRLVSVNHEAREVAVRWAQKKGFVVQRIEGYPIMSCPFNPGRDILYIPHDEVATFMDEPIDILNKVDPANREPLPRTFVKNFAIMEVSMWTHGPAFLGRLFKHFVPIGMLVILIPTELGTKFADRYLNLQERWEFRKGGAWVWDNKKNLWNGHGRRFHDKLQFYGVLDRSRHDYRRVLADDDGSDFKLQAGAAIPSRHRRSFY
ncbi:uncharacterized protein EAE97_000137 [Botrytis byssoidea]|uniref:2EXR domain-containing protein n=1 Tax=Botrytis byssoidea TaxID=139641 RepID=A0A9P5IZX0_9HELO|nr:uncharacterized protein EAE97_000137 [Botrytis byssoidea]KAF7954878.1 hypothetical protein EAE97_000137 [Botrytis byssoidea]